MVHGNETGSLPAAIRLIETLQAGELDYGGRVSVFVGNPEASRAGKRFLEADLNRVFLPTDGTAHEQRRAVELMPILDAADLFIDFHQTILASESPFYIFPWSVDGEAWARAIAGAEVWVTRAPGQSFSSGTCCADEYVRQLGRVALTLELGEQGIRADAEQRCLGAMLETLALVDWGALDEGMVGCFAEKRAPLALFETVHAEAFADPAMCLRAGLVNFQQVSQGEILSKQGTPEIVASCAGRLMFPKYPERSGDGLARTPHAREIFRIVRALDVSGARRYG
jgi:succinylglutamate desuccinylase